MLKFILICLLILNGLVFSLWRGYLSNPLLEARQPQRLLDQKNSEYLKLIPAETASSDAK